MSDRLPTGQQTARISDDERCEICHDTGYYGDNGPGIRGNSEYCPCDQCDPQARAIRVLKRSKKSKCDFGNEVQS